MTNLNGYINLKANADILGGTLVTINANGEAVYAAANTQTIVGVAVNDAKAGEVVAVKLAVPVATTKANAGSYTAGAQIFLGANGYVAATGTVPAGWYVGKTTTLSAAGEIDAAITNGIVSE